MGRVSAATMRRTKGATTSTTGKAMAQLISQLPIQIARKWSANPVVGQFDITKFARA